jgi:hypothetical protein
MLLLHKQTKHKVKKESSYNAPFSSITLLVQIIAEGKNQRSKLLFALETWMHTYSTCLYEH